ncbi:AraC family transcriptional regulator [Rhizobium sp. 0TCS1.26]|uniref:helix-turn-helix domain-containing protein n=1 Tax=Rhizobium sp. 0TCS1.26 TaxID=3142623 RepID=UPI003D287C1A
MLSVPLPFISGLVFALTLYRTLRGVETPGPRRYFLVFLAAYALQGMLVGLRFGYGIETLATVQPATASLMPPLAYLAFRSLAAAPVAMPGRHLIGPIMVVAAVIVFPPLVDPLLVLMFAVYGVLLYRLTVKDPEAVAEASLHRAVPALRAARLTAGLMFFFAATDTIVALMATTYGRQTVPLAVSLMNIAAIAAVLIYYFLPEPSAAPAPAATRAAALPNAADRALLVKIESALDAGELFCDENLSLARLARKAGLPARDVSAVINRVTGLNVSQFVNARRIREACRLLAETDRGVTDIMFSVGFATKSNFNREFRRVAGTSPSQWRQSHRSA